MLWGVLRDFREQIEGGADGQRDEDKVGGLQCPGKFPREGFVNRMARVRFTSNLRAIPAGNVNVGGEFAQGQRERAAN
jgi:hypothetical protein